MSHVAVLGGGVVGLSIAWELAGRGADVTLLEKYDLGRKASWAGAGILVPSELRTATHFLDRLTALSNELHGSWAAELFEKTGIDNGFRVCGGVYLAWTPGEVASLEGLYQDWTDMEVPCEWMDTEAIRTRLPRLAQPERLLRVLWAPTEAQIRNPDHLRALAEGCRRRRVEIITGTGQIDIVCSPHGNPVVRWGGGERTVDHVVVAAGAWSTEIANRLGVTLPVEPVRGQMVLYRLDRPPFECIVNVGSRYLVPRRDGHVLVGSTTEEVGFCEETTRTAIDELKAFAAETCADLTADRCVRAWAGLRPASWDGVPYIGRIPDHEKVWIASGHFKVGLQQSPGTAVLLADLIEGKQPAIDPAPFDPARVQVGQH